MVRSMLLLLLLAGCTTHKIHVFNNSLSDAELADLSRAIAELGLRPQLRDLDVPVGITGPTIVMPRVVRDQASIDELEAVLNRHGLSNVRVESHSVHNHSYTDGNIGLYLTNREIARQRQAEVRRVDLNIENLSRVYMSECESIDAELNLTADGLAILEIYEWDEATSSDKSVFIAGSWHAEDSRLTLALEQTDTLTFTVAESQTRTSSGDTRGIDLLRTSPATEQTHSRCNFRYIEQVPGP
ncbi:MAG: hypothetical protein WD071_17345 [Pseudohongiella sp.]|uniref:hypothetical protein n=1 Tax=Pseudohongiella sp. TaxID=1979412 RepID=UPI0034A0077D